MNLSVNEDIRIVPVRGRRALRRFIALPRRLHADDPNYIAPLSLERMQALSPQHNPYFEHAEVQLFLARRNGRDVGRISAQIDHLEEDKQLGHFGLIAAENDPAIFSALFDAAENWLARHGRSRVTGPFNLSINEETGLLVKGFDTPPMLLMGHDLPFVGDRIEEQGYRCAKNLIAYLYDIRQPFPASVQRLVDRPLAAGMVVRPMDMTRYREEIEAITEVFNDAWSDNWGFVPYTAAEVDHMARALKPILDPKMVSMLELDGELVGFGIALPNINEAIADFGGHLLPFNWARLLWRLKVRDVTSGRVPLMGVRRKLRSVVGGTVAPFLIIDGMRKGLAGRKINRVELSWILEDNLPMCRINEALGGVPYKTYRLYEKSL